MEVLTLLARSAIDMDLSSHLLLRDSLREGEAAALSPSKREYQRVMAENLGAPELATSRVLAFQAKPPTAPEGHNNNLKVLEPNLVYLRLS